MIIDVGDCGLYTVVCMLRALFMSCILGGRLFHWVCPRGYETGSSHAIAYQNIVSILSSKLHLRKLKWDDYI